MNALLTLLVLLSVVTLFSRQKLMARIFHVGATSLLIFAGYILSPQGLFILMPSTVDAFEPALRMALLWSTFLIGLRFGDVRPQPGLAKQSSLTFLYAAISLSLCLLASFFLLLWLINSTPSALSIEPYSQAHLGLSLILSGLFSSSSSLVTREVYSLVPEKLDTDILFATRHDDFISVTLVIVGLALWPAPKPYAFLTPALMPIVLGAVLALAVRLVMDASSRRDIGAELALVGFAGLGAGWAMNTGTPEALVGFVFGLTLAQLHQSNEMEHSPIMASAPPIRLAICILAGFHLEFSTPPIALGLLIAAVRILSKFTVKKVHERVFQRRVPLAAVSGFSGAALPLALSFFVTPLPNFNPHFLLVTLTVALALNDVTTILLWPKRERMGSSTEQGESYGR